MSTETILILLHSSIGIYGINCIPLSNIILNKFIVWMRKHKPILYKPSLTSNYMFHPNELEQIINWSYTLPIIDENNIEQRMKRLDEFEKKMKEFRMNEYNKSYYYKWNIYINRLCNKIFNYDYTEEQRQYIIRKSYLLIFGFFLILSIIVYIINYFIRRIFIINNIISIPISIFILYLFEKLIIKILQYYINNYTIEKKSINNYFNAIILNNDKK